MSVKLVSKTVIPIVTSSKALHDLRCLEMANQASSGIKFI